MKTTKKALLLTCCALILVAASVMGTMAYMTAKDDVQNTFAAAELLEGDFVLTEHKLERDASTGVQTLSNSATTDNNKYNIVPGAELPKDPWVEFTLKDSAYLFVAVEDSLPEDMKWTPADGWKKLMDGGNQVKTSDGKLVYVYGDSPLTATEEPYKIYLIKNNKVTVDGAIDLNALDGDKTLNFYGYLMQGQTFASPLAAWQALVPSL